MKKLNYLVVGSQPWNREIFDRKISRLPGRWAYCSQGERLASICERLKPRYVFFLHWSKKVPDDLIQRFECVCFHMTDVPFGRGGTPLQNLILRGLKSTKVTALRIISNFNAEPVYAKRRMSLTKTTKKIYIRACDISAELIRLICRKNPVPVAQHGRVTIFKRRTPEQSRVPKLRSNTEIHDYIRMLDAPGYPKAFLEIDGYRYEFSSSVLKGKELTARVKITKARRPT
jgi:methionyl-tRNA formyltransferase